MRRGNAQIIGRLVEHGGAPVNEWFPAVFENPVETMWGRAEPSLRPLCNMRSLGGRDVAARHRGQHGTARWGGSARRRHELRGKRQQQIRLAVEQIRAMPARSAAGALAQAGAAWDYECRPAARIAGASVGKTPARVAPAKRNGIRTKLLGFPEFRPRIQAVTGRCSPIGSDFRHQRGSNANEAGT
jgi:hypothetical protein